MMKKMTRGMVIAEAIKKHSPKSYKVMPSERKEEAAERISKSIRKKK